MAAFCCLPKNLRKVEGKIMKFPEIKAKWPITGLAISMLAWMILFPYSSQAIGTQGREGEATFNAKCSGCHGAFGSGSTVIGKKLNLRDMRSEEVQKLSDAQIYEIINKGRNKMPAFGKSLGEQKVKQLVAYIRELGKKR
jgi:mono/diheme cytochrome c family protein